MKKYLSILIAIMAICHIALAQTFMSDGIRYTVTSATEPRTVQVASNTGYIGEANIPETVSYESNTYAVTEIGYSAFYICSGLTSVTIPNSVINIEPSAFFGCSGLTSVAIPNSVTSIYDAAFRGCSGLTSVTIPNSVTAIGRCVFQGCSNLHTVNFDAINLTSFLPDGGDGIYLYSMFLYCTSLTTLNIGKSVKTIYYDIFSDCENISVINVNAIIPPTIYGNTFLNVSSTIPVYVPCGTSMDYMDAPGWANFRNIQDNGIYRIALRANNSLMGVARVVEATCESEVAIIYAIPHNGYRFVQWNDGNTEYLRTLTLNSDTAFVAEFTIDTFALDINELHTSPYLIYATNRTLTVKHAEGENIAVFDMMGRTIFQTTAATESNCNLPNAGLYIVRIGEKYCKKLVVN